MGEALSLDNILGEEEINNLFTDADNKQETAPEDDESSKDNTTEIDSDNLFEDNQSEGVGSENDTEERGDTDSEKQGTSPKNFYSSIAKALKEEGIFPDLDDENLGKINKAEDLAEVVRQQIESGLDERQKRISKALDWGVEPSEIKKYENTLNFLSSIKDESLTDESDNGEKLRKNLIYQDFINRGYSKERAEREVQKSFNAGSDIEDAKEALKGNKEYFTEKYNALLEDAKKDAEKDKKESEEQAEKLKKSILEDNDIFGDLVVDKSTRQKIYDNITKPVYKDPDTGEYLTAIQRYEMNDQIGFLKNVGILFTLTNGFKDINNLVKTKVRKEMKKGLKELENTLNNTRRTSDGNLKFISSIDDDPESFIGKNWKLDI